MLLSRDCARMWTFAAALIIDTILLACSSQRYHSGLHLCMCRRVSLCARMMQRIAMLYGCCHTHALASALKALHICMPVLCQMLCNLHCMYCMYCKQLLVREGSYASSHTH